MKFHPLLPPSLLSFLILPIKFHSSILLQVLLHLHQPLLSLQPVSLLSDFPSLSYTASIYFLHVSLTSSGSVTVFPALSVTLTFLLVIPLLQVIFRTLAYCTKSDLL